MFCNHCGAQQQFEVSKFCNSCGNALSVNQSAPTTAAPIPGAQAQPVKHRQEFNPMEQVLMTVSGVNGQIDLLRNKIRIKRVGFLALMGHGLKGDKDILLSQISSIQFRAPGMMTNGYIQFAFVGGREAKGGILEATKDENTVMFKSSQFQIFQRLKSAIEEQMNAGPYIPSAISPLDELEKLGTLRDKGIVTEEEFQAKKRQLLGLQFASNGQSTESARDPMDAIY